MPDIETVTTEVTRGKGIRARVWLAAGQRLVDKSSTLAVAQRTVPAGKHARLHVSVRIELFDGPLPEGTQDLITET